MPPLVIQVRIKDGDIIVKPDPARKTITAPSGEQDFEIHWHYPQGGFSIIFEKDLDTPLKDGTWEKEDNGSSWIKTEVKEHDKTEGYVYEVIIPGTSGKKPLEADPGLIIDP